jgi:DNA-binding GntR family transcriptional regulator
MDQVTTKKRAGNSGAVIYDRLREDILAGRLQPGIPLSQSAIAKEAGTSRGPVNEALRRLQQDRLVIARANQRFSVAPFTIMDLEAIFCLHLANNALAVQISVPFLTDEELETIDEGAALLDMSFEQDKSIWEKGYHKILFTSIKHSSARSVDLAQQLIEEMRRHRTLWPKTPPVWLITSDFKEFIVAARARNGKLASIYFAQLMGRMASLLMAGTDPTYDAFRLRQYIKIMSQANDQG